jgi:hypothetical protein
MFDSLGGFWEGLLDWWRRFWELSRCFILKLLYGQPEVSYETRECIYRWDVRYRVDLVTLNRATQRAAAVREPLAPCAVVITVRIRLEPDPDVSAAELAALRPIWEQGIQSRWSNRFIIRRIRGECLCAHYAVRFDVHFVDSGEHQTVQVRRGPARSNMTTWDTEDGADQAAHEFGHMLGHADEYPDENCPDRTLYTDNSVMRGSQISGYPQFRHYQQVAIAAWVRTCCEHVVVSEDWAIGGDEVQRRAATGGRAAEPEHARIRNSE